MAYNNGKQAVVSVLGGTRITAHFGDDGRATGTAGCNQYFASYEVKSESISIALPGATRRFCAEPSPSAATATSGIRFDLDRVNADGLQGPPDGLRALHYEYCIPDQPEAVQAVNAIDPTLQIQGESPGRVGCGAGELLFLGHTHQPGHRAVLEQLAALPFVAEILEAFFE